jgi:hypothetical protein
MTDESFKVFNYMDKSCSSWNIAMDTAITSSTTDAQSTKICCSQCQCCFWPLILIFDILSCPFRACIYCKNKK